MCSSSLFFCVIRMPQNIYEVKRNRHLPLQYQYWLSMSHPVGWLNLPSVSLRTSIVFARGHYWWPVISSESPSPLCFAINDKSGIWPMLDCDSLYPFYESRCWDNMLENVLKMCSVRLEMVIRKLLLVILVLEHMLESVT